MKHITTDELKQMPVAEGLVLQGCGGDPDEWVIGINETLTEAGILLDGDIFKDIYIFEHNGLTNMLFSMEDVKLDIGKMAMWRLQSHGTFGGTWLSDYIPNQLGAERPERGADHAEAGTDTVGPEENPPTDNATALRAYIVNTDDMADMFADIDRLRDGGFAGKWHSFPTTAAELQATLKEIGVDGVKHKDFHINNYYTELTALHSRLAAHADIDEFNYLAAKLEELTESQREVFEAALETGRHCESVADIINLTENLERFDLQPAYTPEMYGAFLLETEKDSTLEVFDRLEKSSNADECAFAQYVLRLEAYIDETDYGRGVAGEEHGAFTKHGYLTEGEGFKEVYRGPEDIPAEYRVFAYPETGKQAEIAAGTIPAPIRKVENTDLTTLLAKMHVLGGDYAADIRHNLNVLEARRSAEYLLLMNGRHAFLTEAAHVYRHGTDSFDAFMGADEENIDTRIFALHITDMHQEHVVGDLAELNVRKLQLDLFNHSIRPVRIDATPKFGPDVSYAPEEWGKLEAIDRHMLQSWTRRFDPADSQAVIRHLEEVGSKHAQSGTDVSPDELLSILNAIYMEGAENPRQDMLRIPISAAKDMLTHGDAAVYRLLPQGAKELSPLDAMQSRGGLWYQEYREFAVRRDAAEGLDKWAKRETEAITRRQPEREAPDKPKSHGPEL